MMDMRHDGFPSLFVVIIFFPSFGQIWGSTTLQSLSLHSHSYSLSCLQTLAKRKKKLSRLLFYSKTVEREKRELSW